MTPSKTERRIKSRELEMKTTLKACTATFAMLAMVGQSWAGGLCARPDEHGPEDRGHAAGADGRRALLQRHRGSTTASSFRIRRELQDSDAALHAYFVRANAVSGEGDYHAYKTRLANNFSLIGLHAMQTFCEGAKMTFDTVLNVGEHALSAVVATLPDARGNDRTDCTETAAITDPSAGASDAAATHVASDQTAGSSSGPGAAKVAANRGK